MTLAGEKVRELKLHGAAINLPGRKWVDQATGGFHSCRGNDSAAYDEQTGETVFFYTDPKTGLVLAAAYEKDNGIAKGLRYAFMSHDGRVLSYPEYCGIIRGKENDVGQFRKMLIRGLASFTP